MTMLIVLGSVSTDLEYIVPSNNIFDYLDDFFSFESDKEKNNALLCIVSSKMAPNVRVRDHVSSMVDTMCWAEVNGATMTEEVQIPLILASLPDTYNEVKRNYYASN